MPSESRQFDPAAELSFRDLEEQLLQRIRSVAAQHESIASQLRSREFELDERRKVVEASHAKLAELASQLAGERESVESRSQEIERLRRDALSHAQSAETARKAAETERDTLRSRLDATLAESRVRLESLSLECGRLRAERDQLATRLDELIAEFARGGAESTERLRIIREQTDAELERLRRGFEVTLCASETRRIAAEARLASAMAECETLKNQLLERSGQAFPASSTSPSAPQEKSPAWLASRPRRLQNIRCALRRRALELRALREELTRRAQECDARPPLILHASCSGVPGAQSREPTRGVFKAAGFLMLISSVAGASWVLSGVVGSETYQARATIGISPKDRPLSSEEIARWNTVHRELLHDPLFHEAAAARFRNIGEYQLGDATRVGSFINASLTAESTHGGELVLRLRDARPQDAERRLESLASALTCYANGAAELRLSSATTKITAAPVVDETPVASDRVNWLWRFFAALSAGISLPVAYFSRRTPKPNSSAAPRYVPDEDSHRNAA